MSLQSSNAKTKKLDADMQLKMSSEATFTASKDWLVTTNNDMVILEDPDHEVSLVLIENSESNVTKAIEAAWKQYKPDFSRFIKQAINLPPQDGWSEFVQVEYETTTQERYIIFVLARKSDKMWYIAIIEGAKQAFDRRAAQIMTTITSLKVRGVQEESFAGKKAYELDAGRLKSFEAFFENARVQCKIPGAAIALVQDGKIIFEKGFGVRALGKEEKVSPETLFMIGSTTKSLTAFMMACLVDEGKFTWDTPLTQLLPTFILADRELTNQLAMKYTVSASTGLPRQDMEFIFNYKKFTPKMRIEAMSSMKPTTGFGETFQYSNGMVAAGGYIAALTASEEREFGCAYDSVMKSQVFDPIGMKSTTFDFNEAQSKEHAVPHGQTLTMDYVPKLPSDEHWVYSIRPAGGAWSNVKDMARYVLTELNKGLSPDGKQVISEANLLKRREPQVKMSAKNSYGLAFIIEDDHGVKVIGHGGATMGFSSLMDFLPEHNVGIVMLTNARGAHVFTSAVRRRLMELLFDGKPEAQELIKFGIQQHEQIFEKMREGLSFIPDLAWIGKIVGTYVNESLGKITLQLSGDKAIIATDEWQSALGQKREKDGMNKIILLDAAIAGLEFIVYENHENNDRTTLTLEMPQQRYIFERVC